MTLLNGHLPIFQERSNSRPISASLDSSQLASFLSEQARIERLSSTLLNKHNANPLLLEPITHELFEVFKDLDDVDMDNIPTSEDAPMLLSVDHLDILEDSDTETEPKDSGPKGIVFDLSAYRERRKELSEFNMSDLMEIEEEEQGNSIPVSKQVEQTIAPVENMPSVPVEVPSVPAETQSAPPPAVQPSVQPEQPSVQPEQSNTQPEQPSVQPEQSNTQPVQPSVQPEQSNTQPKQPPTSSTDSIWYKQDQFSTDLSTKGTPIYAYPTSIIPIFSTPDQVQESNVIVSDSRAQASMFFNTNFDRAIQALNLPTSMIDLDYKEQWSHSGKTCFVYHLLQQLKDQDLYLAIITKDINDEAVLWELIRADLRLCCTRLNYALDDTWDGEYGVVVRTKPQPMSRSSQAVGEFNASVDMVLCLDVRIARKRDVFEKLHGTQGQPPPIVWMIALGSVEMKAFELLKNYSMSTAVFKSEIFKTLFTKENEWPDVTAYETLNAQVAANVASWLSHKTEEYQFRSTIELPQSYLLGYLPVQQIHILEDGEIEDMDISSDSEEIQADPRDLVLQDYIYKDLLPHYTIVKQPSKELPNKDTLISDNGQYVLNSIVEDYSKQVETIRHLFEKTLEDLQHKYKEKAKLAIPNIKK
ncbi:uncharacterized protein B0P05DRAFT_621088 [Gilbertella persicaria]|uniref:uncharacterized protein n=1 Tax=Gilbertella persicaria TaxID=101096 RepID=UPI002220CD49|nr:uncharacterized protein B0P05DRAFT_621088 [Gilbertella persicaria]KAI8066982.1 hypothetical protein B0P05DRAFT_621088 [Gilbertella persicaria]